MKARELLVTYRANPDAPTMGNHQIKTPQAAAAILTPLLEHQAQEVFVILLLNAKHKPIAYHEIARGGITSVSVQPRIIIRAALLVDAVALVLAHNHPSGDPSPSPDDIELTRRIKAAAAIFDIETLDHLIIGEKRYHSLKEHGIL